ncbi:MAG: hypothetical protein AAFY48_09575 [Bacteroidota bacterium]
MLDYIPKWSRWLAGVILLGSLLGYGGRIYVVGEGVERDKELFFGILDHLPTAQYLDASILIMGILVAGFLLVFSFLVQRFLRSNWRPFWLYLHLSITIVLLMLPLYCYEGWSALDGPSDSFAGRLLPAIDDLTRHDFRVMFRIDFALAATFLYGFVINMILLAYGFYQAFNKPDDAEPLAVALDEHLLR